MKASRIIVLFLALAFSAPAAHAAPTNMSLFLLMGQSNMSGRGVMPATWATTPRGWMVKKDYRWYQATEPSDDPTNAVDQIGVAGVPSYSAATGFAVALANAEPATQVGLIPCAKGASSLVDWAPNYSDQTLYGACLKRARAATTMGHYAGILFWQGEQEAAGVAPSPDQWAANFKAIALAMRSDLGAPNLPVVIAQIRNVNWPYTSVVQAQQATVPSILPNSAMITTSDLPDIGDTIHVNSPGLDIAGQRFSDAYEHVVNPLAPVATATPLPAPTSTPTATPTVAAATATPTVALAATATPVSNSISATPNSVTRGASITVAWHLLTPGINDWFGFYPIPACSGCQPLPLDYSDFRRLDCTQGSGYTSPPDGSCSYNTVNLPAGNYQIALIDWPSGTNKVLAQTSLTIH